MGVNRSLQYSAKETIHQVGEDCKALAKEESQRLWNTLAVDLPGTIDLVATTSNEVFRREKPSQFEIVFRAECIKSEESRKTFRGIKAPGNKLLNAQHRKILSGIIEKYQAKGEFIENSLGACKDKVREINRLEDLCKNQRNGRGQLDYLAWRGFDRLNFINVRDYFISLFHEFKKDSFDEVVQDTSKYFDYREALVGEVLAQVLVYVEGLNGKTIQIPTVLDGTITMVTYKINEMCVGDALPCYLLESSDVKEARPWLIIRGTQHQMGKTLDGKEFRKGAFESLLADMIDSNGIAEDVVNKALVHTPLVRNSEGTLEQRESIGSVLLRCKQQGTTLTLAGHSLGGTLVKYLAAQFPNQVHKAYCFSSPGNSDYAHKVYKKACARDQARMGFAATKQKIINFLYQYDPLHLVGSWQMGTKFEVVSLEPTTRNGVIDAHVRPHLNHDFGMRPLKSKQENYKFARFVGEFVRWFLGRIIHVLISVIRPSVIPDWYRHRYIYRVRRDEYIKTYFPEYL